VNTLAHVRNVLFGLLLVVVVVQVMGLFGWGPVFGIELYRDVQRATMDESARAQLSELSERQKKWIAQRPQSYRFQFRWSCLCISHGQIFSVHVNAGTVTGVNRETEPGPLNADTVRAERFPTINGLFETWKRDLRTADNVEVTYDSTQLAPVDVFVDGNRDFVDDEITYHVHMHSE
jgi:hypothetical protein